MAAILFDGKEPFQLVVNMLSTEDPMWKLVKIVQAVSEKKTFEAFTILYMYITQGQGHLTPKILMVAKQFYFFNHTLLISSISF